jgi:ABC-type Mn2+/Zn2+ transport system permease subunit
MSQTLELLGEKFVQDALIAALLVALLCSFLGVFVVLKRIVFVGAALAEVSSLGAALAFFTPVVLAYEQLSTFVPALEPLHHFKPLILALALMMVAVAFFSHPRLGRHLPREALIGATFAGAIGLTVLVRSRVPAQAEHAMEALMGNILGVEPLEITELYIACVLVGLIQSAFYKEFVLVSFDPEVARTLGYRSSRWELLWYLSLGVMIAVSIHVSGTILVFTYLVVPPVTALMLSRRLGAVFFLSVLLGVLATFAGVLLSVSPADLPTSPAIVSCAVALLLLCWLAKWLAGLAVSTGGAVGGTPPAPSQTSEPELVLPAGQETRV